MYLKLQVFVLTILHHIFSRRIKKLFWFVILFFQSRIHQVNSLFKAQKAKGLLSQRSLIWVPYKLNYYISRFPLALLQVTMRKKLGSFDVKKSNISLLWKNISQSLMWKRINTSNKGPVDHRTKQQYWTVFLRSGKTVFKQEIVWTGKQKLFNSWRFKIRD